MESLNSKYGGEQEQEEIKKMTQKVITLCPNKGFILSGLVASHGSICRNLKATIIPNSPKGYQGKIKHPQLIISSIPQRICSNLSLFTNVGVIGVRPQVKSTITSLILQNINMSSEEEDLFVDVQSRYKHLQPSRKRTMTVNQQVVDG